MKVEDLLEELVGLTEDSKELPFINKSVIEKNQILDIVDEIRANLPHEIRQAKAIVADRANILDEAKKEAETVIRVAEDRRKAMLDENELIVLAKEEADKIVQGATAQAKSIKNAANQYVNDILAKTEKSLSDNLADFQRIRQSILSVNKKRPKPTANVEE